MSDQPIAPASGQPAPETCTVEEFRKKMDDPAFREAYLRDPETYEARITDLPGRPQGEPPAPSAGGAPPAAPQGQPAASETYDVIVNGQKVQVSREQLGSYAVNRDPAAAIVEALKGNREKDKTIEALLQRDRENEQSTTSLRQRIKDIEARKQQPAQPATPAAPAPGSAIVPDDGVSEADVDALEKEYDPFDDAGKQKLFVHLRKQAAEINRLKTGQQEALQPVKNMIEETNKARAQQAIDEAKRRSTAAEFTEIESLLSAEQELRPQGKTFQQLDLEVAEWIHKVKSIAPKGKDGYVLFFEQGPAGDAFRAQCEASGATPPQEYKKHQAIMNLRSDRRNAREALRKQLSEWSGKEVQDYDLPSESTLTYADIYNRRRRQSGADKQALLDAQISGHRKMLDATDHSDRAREIPPEKSVPPRPDWKSVGQETISKLLAKHSSQYSDEEANLIMDFYNDQKMSPPPGLKARVGQR